MRLDLLDVLFSTPWQWHALFRQKKPEKRVKPNRQIIDDDEEGAKALPLFLAVIHQIREKENTGWKWNEIHARTEPNPTQPQSSWNWNPRRIQFCQLQALASSPNYLSLSSPVPTPAGETLFRPLPPAPVPNSSSSPPGAQSQSIPPILHASHDCLL